jgi:hypothetical protein
MKTKILAALSIFIFAAGACVSLRGLRTAKADERPEPSNVITLSEITIVGEPRYAVPIPETFHERRAAPAEGDDANDAAPR